jgi:TPR repeat protein
MNLEVRGYVFLGLLFVAFFAGHTYAETQTINWNTPIETLKVEAEKGNPDAQLELAYRYDEGRNGCSVDKEKSAEWFQKGAKFADKNSVAGFICKGNCLQNGYGITKDETEAIKWYQKAAETGDARGQLEMGWQYNDGNGVEKNENEAVKWFRKAAEQGFPRAQNMLGICYYDGEGVEKDQAEAVKWVRKAAEQKYAPAQNNLGFCYHEGKGVSQDFKEAVKWYRKAAEQGDNVASKQIKNIESLVKEQYEQDVHERQILDKEYQESLARNFARQTGEQVMAAIGGGRDLRVKVNSWQFDKFTKQFDIELDIYFNGKLNRENNYHLSGVLTIDDKGKSPKFARSYANDKFKSLEQDITILKILGGTVLILHEMNKQE